MCSLNSIILIFILARSGFGKEEKRNINDYLLDLREYTLRELENYNAFSNGLKRVIEFYDWKTVNLPKKYNSAHVFTLFNEQYVLLNQDIFYMLPEADGLSLTAPKFTFPKFDDEIKFIKSVENLDLGIVLVAYNHGIAKIYGYGNKTNEHFLLLQTIKSPNNFMDAKFFWNKQNLYLITSSQIGVAQAPIIVYKWVESHFDEVDKIFVAAATSLTTFSYFDSEIIVLLRNYQVEKTHTYVFKFQSEKLRKIQVLNTQKPTQVLSFEEGYKQHLVIFDEEGLSFLYLWDGDEFVPFQRFDSYNGVKNVLSINESSISIIFGANQFRVYAFASAFGSIEHIYDVKFQRNFLAIYGFEVINFNGTNKILTIGLSDDSNISYTLVSYKIDEIEIVNSQQKTDDLLECLNELENTISLNDETLSGMSNLFKNKLKVDLPQELKGRLNIAAPVVAEVANLMLENGEEEEIKNLEENIEILEDRISIIENVLPSDPQTEKIFYGKVIIEAAILGDNLNSKNLISKKINGINWAPNEWLSYSQDQVITGTFNISKLNVDELFVNDNNNINTLNNFLLLNGNQEISATAKLRSLNSSNIFANEINEVPLEKIYLRNQPVNISGRKTVSNVNTKNIQIESFNNKTAFETIKLFGDSKGIKYEFLPETKIINLYVEYINDVNWDTFSNSVFRIGKTPIIQGTLRVPSVWTDRLVTNHLSDIEVNKILTTNTDQVVDSIIHFEKNVNSAITYCDKINNLDFSKDVVTFEKNGTTFINGLVIFKNVKINGTLFLNESIESFYKTKEVFGNNDLLQIYNNKIKIFGNVYLKSLYLPNPAKIFIDGNEFNQIQFNDYWLKNTNQEIPIHFTALEGITTPHINTAVLNNHHFNSYMINNLDDKPKTRLAFSNLTVLGNIIINENLPHVPDLQMLDKESVKLNGTFVLKGRKEFLGILSIDNLKTDKINTISMAEIPTKSSVEYLGSKSFNKIIVEGNVSSKSLIINRINNIDLKQMEEDTIYTDRPTNVKNLDFANIKAENFYTKKINNKLFNEYILSLDQIYVMDKLKILKVQGNATINNCNNLKYINDINIDSKMANNDPVLNSVVKFEGTVYAKNLFVSNVNDIDFQNLLPRLYFRYWPQNITARHSFKVLKASNILTSSINDKNVENIIDVSSDKPQLLILDNGLRIENAKFEQSLFAEDIECSLPKALEALSSIPTRPWNYVKVEKNVTILDNTHNLNVLFKNAVHLNRTNIIKAPVIFGHISAENIKARKNINSIDLEEIVNDALLANSHEQIVTGFKEFSSLKVSSAAVMGFADLPYINSVDILLLNKSIIHKNDLYKSPIRGHKTFFFGLQTTNFNTNNISGVFPENLVSLDNPLPIPSARFNSMEVLNDMDITSVKDKNFDEFLNSRMLINSEKDQFVSGVFYFEDIELKANSKIPYINNLEMSDVVFDEGLQIINSPKKFNQEINIFGNANMEKLNGISINKLYEDSIKFNEFAEIDGNVQFNDISEIRGNIQVENINGVPVKSIKEMLVSNVPQVRVHIVQDLIKNITDVLTENKLRLEDLPSEYLYLEKSDTFQVKVPHAISAQIINHNEDIIIHIQTEEQGHVCFLPQKCPCPGQNSVQILPAYSINEFSKKSFQRVFSFEIPEMVVHVVTNSISTNRTCRTDNSTLPETTQLNWITSPSDNSSGAFFSFPEEITGYISDVKFFVYDAQVYVIIARYYDSIENSHNIETLVFKFSKENDKIEEIQKIKTNGAWNLHVFSTAQGFHLVIGVRGIQNDYSTGIYRFNEASKMFEILRYVSIRGCLSSTSIVVGYESFIILASENEEMQILKYDYKQYNYIYQTDIYVENIISVSSFKIEGGVNEDDVFLAAVSNTGQFYIFSYKYLAGWQLLSKGQIKELRSFIPFSFQGQAYIFAASKKESSILNVVQYGLN